MSRLEISMDTVRNYLQEQGLQQVMVAVVDVDGILRGKYIHADKFFSAIKSGFGFCSVVFGWDAADLCYDNVAYTGWHSGYPDAQARLDLGTFRKLPWNKGMPFFLGDFIGADERPLAVCPRSVLKGVLSKAQTQGFDLKAGFEFEWFNFRETPNSLVNKSFTRMQPISPGMFGYSLIRAGQAEEFMGRLMNEMAAFNVPLEGLHTETGPGVYEAAIMADEGLEAADRAVLFKMGVKRIAHDFGIMPTFMAKWNAKLPGSSGHIHQSLWKDGENIFYSPDEPYRMSQAFQSYLAGQLLLLPDFLPFYAPTVNSYKRLVEGLWAPTKVSWGVDNRTVPFRVIPGSEKSTRIEVRVTGADINPYLALAASLASGLYGMEHRLELKDTPIRGSAYEAKRVPSLATNLYEATKRLAKSKIAREIFGDHFIQHFVNTRLWEWRQHEQAVSNWEIERYFEII